MKKFIGVPLYQDKNGEDICEGDEVIVDYKNNLKFDLEGVYTIVFEDFSFGIKRREGYSMGTFQPFSRLGNPSLFTIKNSTR